MAAWDSARIGASAVTGVYLGATRVWARQETAPEFTFRVAHPLPSATLSTTQTFPVSDVGPAAEGTYAIFIAGTSHRSATASSTITISTVEGVPVTQVGGLLSAVPAIVGIVTAGIVDVSGLESITMRITTSGSTINWTGALWTVDAPPQFLSTSAGSTSATYAPPAGSFTAGIYLSEASGLGAPAWSGVASRYQDATSYPVYGFRGDYADGAVASAGVTHSGTPARHVFYHFTA